MSCAKVYGERKMDRIVDRGGRRLREATLAFALTRDDLQMINTYIQLITNQQYKGIKIDQQHEDHNGADGSIYPIVVTKAVDPIRESERGQDGQKGSEESARGEKFPALFDGGAIFVDASNGDIK